MAGVKKPLIVGWLNSGELVFEGSVPDEYRAITVNSRFEFAQLICDLETATGLVPVPCLGKEPFQARMALLPTGCV